ncbi:hypothetical protein Ahy_A03g011393 [Arachis hypogaea]|uniref:Uncharacterized protein n=1 Tax=Arachis hypogaea TaxID=3818 RepID=A0A445DQJ6_ARAHY|nr:hypothetical protein Ahy_A03g011393 [Arachis hypogaea]
MVNAFLLPGATRLSCDHKRAPLPFCTNGLFYLYVYVL